MYTYVIESILATLAVAITDSVVLFLRVLSQHGFLDAAAIRLQGQELPLIGAAPVQLIQALPYILTVVLLAGFIGKAVPPKAGGTPYVKER